MSDIKPSERAVEIAMHEYHECAARFVPRDETMRRIMLALIRAGWPELAEDREPNDGR